MPSIDGGPQEDPNWMVEAVEAITEEKFDFENIDVKLYLALKAIISYAENEVDGLHTIAGRDGDEALQIDAVSGTDRCEAARLAMKEFEQSHGPLPDWAVARNWDYSLVPGAQLCTKDGRRTGNAHIIRIPDKPVSECTTYYHCLTDAGGEFRFSEVEILEAFTIGDWISDPKRVLKDFDRHGHYADL